MDGAVGGGAADRAGRGHRALGGARPPDQRTRRADGDRELRRSGDAGSGSDAKTIAAGRELAASLSSPATADETPLSWQLVDADDATRGLADGTYYGVLTIPKSFSASVTSTSGTKPEQAQLKLVSNDAASAAVAALAQLSVNEAARSLGDQVTSNYVDAMLQNLTTINKNLTSSAKSADSLASSSHDLADSASQLADSSDQVSDGADSLDNGTKSLESGTTSLASGAAEAATGAAQVSSGSRQLASAADKLASGAGSAAKGADAVARVPRTWTMSRMRCTRDRGLARPHRAAGHRTRAYGQAGRSPRDRRRRRRGPGRAGFR